MVTDKGSFIFGELTTFEKAYSRIKEISIICKRDGKGLDEWSRVLKMNKENFREKIPCSNPCCKSGEFDIGLEVFHMLRQSHTNREVTLRCGKHEIGAPRGMVGKPCWNTLTAKIEINYKEVLKATEEKNLIKSPDS